MTILSHHYDFASFSQASSSSHRGRCLCFITMNMMLGSLVASLCTKASNYAEIFQYHYLGWRLSLVVPMITLAFQLVMLYYFPKSPRWLLAKKTPTDCSVSLCTLRRTTETSREFSDIYRALSADARLSDTFIDLLSQPPLRLKLMLTMFLVVVQEIVGGQYMAVYLPQLLHLMKFDNVNMAISAFNLGGLLGSVICFYMLDTRGRRELLMKGAVVMSIAYFMASLCLRYEQLTDQNAFSISDLSSSPLPPGRLPSDDIIASLTPITPPYTANHILLMSSLTVISLCYYSSWGTVAWIYPAEVFPYRSRAKLHALLSGCRYLMALLTITYLSPFFAIHSINPDPVRDFHSLDSGVSVPASDQSTVVMPSPQADVLGRISYHFVLLSILCLVIIVLVYFALPETRGKPLSFSERIFFLFFFLLYFISPLLLIIAGLMLEDMDELFKLEPNAHNHHAQAPPPSGLLHGIYNPHYCCFCLPHHGVLGWRVYTRTVRYVSGSGSTAADGGYHTPSNSHATFHYYQTYSNTHQTGLPTTPYYNTGPSAVTDQPTITNIGLYDEDEEQVLQIYEPSRLHKYSNEMRENKFNYYHPSYSSVGNGCGLLGGGGNGSGGSVHRSGGYAGSEKSSRSNLPASDEEDKGGGLYRYGGTEEVDEAAFMTPHKTTKGQQSEEDIGSDEETSVIHYFDSDRNFLDSLIGSIREGSKPF